MEKSKEMTVEEIFMKIGYTNVPAKDNYEIWFNQEKEAWIFLNKEKLHCGKVSSDMSQITYEEIEALYLRMNKLKNTKRKK